jgi:hypothetical protein
LNSRRARSGVYEFLLKSSGHCLLFSVAGATANRETLLFNFTAIKLSSGLPNVRQEPGRDDRDRLSGRHARDARLHNERGQVLVPAHLIESLIDSLGDQAS